MIEQATSPPTLKPDPADLDAVLQQHRRELTAHTYRMHGSAFEAEDAVQETFRVDSLTSLLSEDASWSMPPFPLWLQTHAYIRKWCLGPGIACRGSRLVPAFANGSAAFGQYKPGPGGLEAWSMQVLELEGTESPASVSFSIPPSSFRCSACRCGWTNKTGG